MGEVRGTSYELGNLVEDADEKPFVKKNPNICSEYGYERSIKILLFFN